MSSIHAQKALPMRSNAKADAAYIEQLRKENSELKAVQEERARLGEAIYALAGQVRLEERLSLLADMLRRVAACYAVFIYTYEQEKQRLVLAGVSEPYQHLVGKLEVALGQGIVGWSAKYSQAVVLSDGATKDPRFHFCAELHEEEYQSIVAIPLVGKERNLVGAIAMQAVAPYDYSTSRQAFAEQIAILAASAIESMQLYQERRANRTLAELANFSRTLSAGPGLDEMLRALAEQIMHIMRVDLCDILLLDSASDRLLVRASSSANNEKARNLAALKVDRRGWDKLNEVRALTFDKDGSRVYLPEYVDTLNELVDTINPSRFKVLLCAPLIYGIEHLGLINCYVMDSRHFTPEDEKLLAMIAQQVATMVKNNQLSDQLAQQNLVKNFFDELMTGTYDSEDAVRRRALALGCDLDTPHLVAVVEMVPLHDRDGAAGYARAEVPWGKSQVVSTRIRRQIEESAPGSVLYERDGLLTILVALGSDASTDRATLLLGDLCQRAYYEQHVRLAIGIGNTCRQIGDYRRGFAEAREALQLGANENPRGTITHFNDLGIYRYLYKLAHMDDLRDEHQEQVACIAEYDQRKGTELLTTLETYLEYAGNLTRASEKLFVHRNTLIQRLERLQTLCSIDIQERSNWFALQVAIKVYKLRAHNV